MLSAGCGLHHEPIVHPPGLAFDRQITLGGRRLTLHLAAPAAGRHLPLLVYATGDRGWAGKDLDVYRHLVAWGYPVAGFDAHDYVSHLDRDTRSAARHGIEAETTTPERLADDYATIIASARVALNLGSEADVVLVGVSRGAGLSVVAAGERSVRDQLKGIVAVALTREEEYVRWYDRLHGRRPPGAMEMVQVYDYLPLLGDLPLTVIQSTNDRYLPAAAARQLFGNDTAERRLIAIEASNHSFAGAREALYDAMKSSLASIASSP